MDLPVNLLCLCVQRMRQVIKKCFYMSRRKCFTAYPEHVHSIQIPAQHMQLLLSCHKRDDPGILVRRHCIRPPRASVIPQMFFLSLGSQISEVPRPIAAKLCHMIAIWRQSLAKVGQFGVPPLKNLGAKNVRNFGRFFATSDFDCEYLRNGLRYPNRNSKCI